MEWNSNNFIILNSEQASLFKKNLNRIENTDNLQRGNLASLTTAHCCAAVVYQLDCSEEQLEISIDICRNLGKRLYIVASSESDYKLICSKIEKSPNIVPITGTSYGPAFNCNFVDTRLASRRLGLVDHFISSNLTRQIREEEIAEVASLSTTYFSKFFRKHKKVSFQEYLSNKRVELSKQLLASQPSEKVSSIAFQVGYSDVSYFNRVFKKHTSLTPTEYRQNVTR